MARADDPPAPGRAEEIEPFWLDYQRHCNVKVEGFSATALGPTRAVSDELALLVRNGVKRAHATLRREFEKDLPGPSSFPGLRAGQGLAAFARATICASSSPDL